MIVWLTNRHHNPLTISEIRKLTLTQIVHIYAAVERDDKGMLELQLNTPRQRSEYDRYTRFCISIGITDRKMIKKLFQAKKAKYQNGNPAKSG
jgi:hypothetical protein